MIQTYNSTSPVNFTSNYRRVHELSTGTIKYMNSTKLFRNDMDWDGFANLLIRKYKQSPKVNIYCYACSDGSEPYSLAIKLLEMGKKNKVDVERFFPIIAKDIDEKMIKMASNGFLPALAEDENLLKKYPKYFEKTCNLPSRDLRSDFIWKVKPELRNRVVFQNADINQDICNIEPENSVVLARNFWFYLADDAVRLSLAKKISSVLDKNSMVVIGGLDTANKYNIDGIFSTLGFNRNRYPTVFEVPDVRYKSLFGNYTYNVNF